MVKISANMKCTDYNHIHSPSFFLFLSFQTYTLANASDPALAIKCCVG